MSCKKEIKRLFAYHEALVRAFPQHLEAFSSWQIELVDLSNDETLESQEGELRLLEMAYRFRQIWLTCAIDHSSNALKSPPHYQAARTQNGEKYKFPYDRWGRPTSFEDRYSAAMPDMEGWSQRHYFFANAMAGVSSLFIHLRSIMAKKSLQIIGFQNYFEFNSLSALLAGNGFTARFCQTEQNYYGAIARGQGDLLLIEPVFANPDLTLFNLKFFKQAWAQRPNKAATILVIDTTLSGDRFDLQDLIPCFGETPPAHIFTINSGLKLFQLGLEFSNLGILSSYVSRQSAHYGHRNQIRKTLRHARQTLGTGLTFDQCSQIEFPLMSAHELIKDHCNQVFRNNALLAKDCQDFQGLIKQVNHPCLKEGSNKPKWAVSPYVTFILREGTKGDIRFLRRVLQRISEAAGIAFHSGSSFGFRFHRFEVNDYHDENEPQFRVAMGSFKGPSYAEILKLLKHIDQFGSFQALRAAYPQIKHPDDP